ncbi:hypothetical protein Agub_g3032, partial [Astrephomene gubernaculifera]
MSETGQALTTDGVPHDLEGGAGAADEEAELAKLEAQLYGNGDYEGEHGSEDAGNTEAQDGDAAGAAPLSKSQMKKRARLEKPPPRMMARRQECRAREKAARAERRAAASERKAAELAELSEEQRAALREESKAKLQAHRDQERQLKERLKQALDSGPRIVIDLDWEARMTPGDMRHLAQQLAFSYAANKAAERPAHLMLTSFKGGVAEVANKMISGMDKWFVTRSEAHYSSLFADPAQRSRLVYLTADAAEELEELSEDKVYIVGGLVDHNRYKGLCENAAKAAGIATARLPINRHIQLASRAVLTVNHVVQILVEYYNRRDWAAVLDHVLPMRKRAEYQQQQQQQGKQKGGQRGKGQQQEGEAKEDTAAAEEAGTWVVGFEEEEAGKVEGAGTTGTASEVAAADTGAEVGSSEAGGGEGEAVTG